MPSRVVLTRRLPEPAMRILKRAESDGAVDVASWDEDRPCDRSWLLREVGQKDTEGLLVMLTDKVDEEVVGKAPKLRIVSTMSVGYDHVSTDVLARRSIKLGYTPDALTDAVADLNIMLSLAAQRRAGEAMRLVLDGDWPNLPWSPLALCGPQIRGATVGFIGFGRIAQATVVRLLGFGISKVLYLTSQPGQPAKCDHYSILPSPRIPIEPSPSASTLASESDIVFITTTLSPSTHHLVDRDFLSKMKKDAVLVNTSRGPVVDSDALADALEHGRIFGAGVDVVEGEPNVGKDHPLVRSKRCVVVPHIGSATVQTREQMAIDAVNNLLAGLKGERMPHEVDL